MPHSSSHALRFWQYAVILALLVLLAVPAPSPAAAQSSTAKLAVFITAPRAKIYEGDVITLPYVVVDLAAQGGLTVAPLTPPSVSATAILGTVSIKARGLDGSITYTAAKAGQEEIVVKHRIPTGTGSGTIKLTVHPKPDYTVEFFVVSSEADPSGGGFLGIFSGTGRFANPPDGDIVGDGSADYWFSLWASNEAFACMMDPPVQARAPFTISESEALTSLVPTPPGSLEPFFIDLNFQPVSLNASNMHCEGLGGLVVDFPWPASQGDANEFGLNNLFFPGEGGVLPVTAAKTTGSILVTRIGQ